MFGSCVCTGDMNMVSLSCFVILFVLKPQAVMQKCKCGKISELYISLKYIYSG